MSFRDDCEDDPVVFTRDAMQIVVSRTDGTHIQTIDLPELKLTREQVDPQWLRLYDAGRLE